MTRQPPCGNGPRVYCFSYVLLRKEADASKKSGAVLFLEDLLSEIECDYVACTVPVFDCKLIRSR